MREILSQQTRGKMGDRDSLPTGFWKVIVEPDPDREVLVETVYPVDVTE